MRAHAVTKATKSQEPAGQNSLGSTISYLLSLFQLKSLSKPARDCPVVQRAFIRAIYSAAPIAVRICLETQGCQHRYGPGGKGHSRSYHHPCISKSHPHGKPTRPLVSLNLKHHSKSMFQTAKATTRSPADFQNFLINALLSLSRRPVYEIRYTVLGQRRCTMALNAKK